MEAMIFTPVFITAVGGAGSASDVCYSITSAQEAAALERERLALLNAEQKFCLGIDIGLLNDGPYSISNEENLYKIVSYFFCYSYMKDKFNHPMLILFSSNDQEADHYRQVLNATARKQGFGGINIMVIPTRAHFMAGGRKSFPLYINLEHTAEARAGFIHQLLNSLEKGIDTQEFLFVRHGTPAEALSIARQLNDELKERNLAAFQLLKRLWSESGRNAAMEVTIEVLGKKLSNYESFYGSIKKDYAINISWHKEEIQKIIDWYHQRYERLPLWFKKSGNLLLLIQNKLGNKTSKGSSA